MSENNEFTEKAKNDNELMEENLENVAGGGATENRYVQNRCMNSWRTMLECVGYLAMIWCDHYRRTETGESIPRGKIYRHKCAMGAWDYLGMKDGDPDPRTAQRYF